MVNFKWNFAQTDATLDTAGETIAVSYINASGEQKRSIYNSYKLGLYRMPQYFRCCHSNRPQLRSMNFTVKGGNQLQQLKDQNPLSGLPNPSSVSTLPNWQDESFAIDLRTRAYLDMNCAHCHSLGGFCDT